MDGRIATIIIPTCKRVKLLRAQLARLGCGLDPQRVGVLVLDGSAEEAEANAESCRAHPFVIYRHFEPELNVFDRIFTGLLSVNTRYASVLADDDTLSLDAHSACIDFLEANKSYIGAAGRFYVYLDRPDSKAQLTGYVYDSPSFEEDSQLARLRGFLKNSNVGLFIYGVIRTPFLKVMAKACLECPEPLDQLAKELLYACVPCVLGKFSRLSNDYYGRNKSYTPSGSFSQQLNVYASNPCLASDVKYVMHPRFSNIYGAIKQIIYSHVDAAEGSPEHIRDHMDESFFLNLLIRIREDPVFLKLWRQEMGTNYLA